MKPTHILLALIFLLTHTIAEAAHRFNPIDTANLNERVLGKSLYMFEDEHGTLLLDDLRSDEYSDQFEPVFVDTPFLGRSRSSFWFRIDLNIETDSPYLILEIAYPHLKHISFFQFQDNTLIKQSNSGYENKNNDEINCTRYCFIVNPTQGPNTIYLKVRSDSPLFVPIVLRTPKAQLTSERYTMAMASFFYGAFAVMALFNLFLFWSTKVKSYLYYVYYIASLGLWTLSHDGILRELTGIYVTWFNSYNSHFIISLFVVSMGALFCQQFLKTSENMPLHHKIFTLLILASVADALLVIFTGEILLPNSVNMLTFIICLAALSVACIGLSQGFKTARFFLIAWLSVILGSFLWIFTLLGILPLNKFTIFSVHIGGLLETILLSLALGDRINVLQAERIAIEQDANRKLEESNRKLAASNLFKNEFLSTISHELRTPMNGIFGASELLEQTPLDTEQNKLLSTVVRSSREMMSMVENILAYTQLEAGTAKSNNAPFKLRKCLEDLALHYRNRAAVQNLDFRYHFDPNIPPDIEGDEDKLRLLLDHLLDNAYKFTDLGQVRFDVSVLTTQDSAATLKFVIRDTGCGVPESLQSEIFDSFRQADNSLTRRKGGLGIGLALSQKIVMIMKGDLDFKSTVGEGTQVTLTLPFELTTIKDEKHYNTIAESITPSVVDILIVEDNYVNKLVMEGQLKNLGFKAYSASNGKEAVSMMEKHEFDLVFMDCQMPIMDGFEATRTIRALENNNASVPIIAVTANTNPGDRENCMAAGMNDYIKKPFNQAALITAINRWLNL